MGTSKNVKEIGGGKLYNSKGSYVNYTHVHIYKIYHPIQEKIRTGVDCTFGK